MHKIFAKPLFLGKKVVFLPQCHSTNDELVQMTRKSKEPEGIVVYTDDQQKGKGQRGNIWVSEPGKNVLMSILLRPKFLPLQDQFMLNLIAGLAIVDTLKECIKEEITLKWPNDIYVNEKKIGGVLIENNLRGDKLESSVVGIGININQKGFAISTATSLALEAGMLFDKEELIENLIWHIEKRYVDLNKGASKSILSEYHSLLMWRGELRVFKDQNGEFYGEIVGIDEYGKLAINTGNELKTFAIKEIQFIR